MSPLTFFRIYPVVSVAVVFETGFLSSDRVYRAVNKARGRREISLLLLSAVTAT